MEAEARADTEVQGSGAGAVHFFSEAEGGARGGEASGFSFSEAERGARGGERRRTNNSCIIGVEKYRQTILGGCPYAFLRVSSDVCEVLFSKPTKL